MQAVENDQLKSIAKDVSDKLENIIKNRSNEK
jgi:hypothetical protein